MSTFWIKNKAILKRSKVNQKPPPIIPWCVMNDYAHKGLLRPNEMISSHWTKSRNWFCNCRTSNLEKNCRKQFVETKHWPSCPYPFTTMLKKLSKCEVKAGLCWNLMISRPLQFYMKSNFGEFKWSKNVIFGDFRGSDFGC